MSTKAIILAAGKGTRMKSGLIKVLHPVAGKPILQYVIDTAFEAGIDEVVVVVGHQADDVKAAFPDPRIQFVVQSEQLGTGHAVLVTESAMNPQSDDTVVILAGDCPLISSETIQCLIDHHLQLQSSGTVLTTNMVEPASYGRILRESDQSILGIKEAKDCSPHELSITEINTGVYAFKISALFSALHKVGTNNKQQEYYLTDVIHLIKTQGLVAAAYCSPDADAAIGVNSRQDLAKVSKVVYRRKVESLMTGGVSFVDPDQSYIDPSVSVGSDTVVHPFTVIQGDSKIGKGCTILPFTHLQDAVIEDGRTVGPQDA